VRQREEGEMTVGFWKSEKEHQEHNLKTVIISRHSGSSL
jgi:hypothetical protein